MTKTLSMFLFKIPQDPLHLTINKIRRCFMYNNQYFQLDIYKEPCHPRFGHSHVIQRIGNVIGKKSIFALLFIKRSSSSIITVGSAANLT